MRPFVQPGHLSLAGVRSDGFASRRFRAVCLFTLIDYGELYGPPKAN